jgi:hypothetical protein
MKINGAFKFLMGKKQINNIVSKAARKKIELCKKCQRQIRKQYQKTPYAVAIANIVFPKMCPECQAQVNYQKEEVLKHNP